MILDQLPELLLGDLQQAARALLRHGVLPADHQRELVLVRRFAEELDQAFSDLLGYRLLLRGGGARLVRERDLLDATPVLETRTGRPFDRDRLALFFLSLAELDRFPHQVALSELASALRRAALELRGAETDSLAFDPDLHAHRRAFCDVLEALQAPGVLRLADGATAAWERDPDQGEALFDVDHDAALLLFRPTRVLERIDSVGDLLIQDRSLGRDPRRQATRQRVARALVEQPVVLFADLDPAAAQYLALEWRSLSGALERLLGCGLERRKEGAALIDAAPGGLGERFPQGGSAGHAALLLAECIARHAGDASPARLPSPAERSAELAAELDLALELPAAARPASNVGPASTTDRQGPLLTRAWLEATARALAVEYGSGLKADHRADPLALLDDGIDLLERFDLVRPVPGGVVATPALARYRRPELVQPDGPQVGLFRAPADGGQP